MDTLIKLLKQNSRLSDAQLAAMTGKTEAEIKAAIEQLEADGVIKGYSVILDEEKAEKDVVTAIIELKVTPQAGCGFDQIAKTIMMYEEVSAVTLMSGGYDLAVTVTSSSLKDIALFVAQRLSGIDGVLSTTTHFVLKRYKEKGFIIDEEETDERQFVSP
ncbi:MAG: Lrp/AsnC family transcriptional regulator [Ruminococcus sp.]|nr:Lrp/AsnC family transcriptional regulator [Ruminococcus sp.]